MDEPVDVPVDVPRKFLRDPKELRALAHPVRIRLLEELAFGGSQTATELAERVDESPANCSWHLRQLQRYGFVEEAGGGRGRQRPWQMVVRQNSWQEIDPDPEVALAGQALADVLIDHEIKALQAARDGLAAEPEEWRDASFVSQTMAWLTADELAAVHEQLAPIYTRFAGRMIDPTSRPAGARPIRLMAWGMPARPYPNDDDKNGDHDA